LNKRPAPARFTSPHWFSARRSRNSTGRDHYARLVRAERQLVEDAQRLGVDVKQREEGAWLSLLLSALTFSINVTEYKLDGLARHAASLINDENVLGATLVVRSMLEHHAVAIELGAKLRSLWDRAEKAAPSSQQVTSALAEAEKQIARVLASSTARARTVCSSIRLSVRLIVSAQHRDFGSGGAPTKRRNVFSPSFGSRALKLRMRSRPQKNTAAAISAVGTRGSRRVSRTPSNRSRSL